MRILDMMTRAIAHRGPDGENRLHDGPVGLSFRRLTLVGPEGGDQPLFSADRSAVLIANGEVYNYRELRKRPLADVRMMTSSDCEVLVHLYAAKGMQFLDDVNGMFAVVLWDRARNRLLLARDRFGIKPLYYVRTASAVIFASEIKALMQHPDCPRELDWEGALADQALTLAPHMTNKPVTTWFRGIESVPAGTIITIDLATGDTSRHQYWQLPDFSGDSGRPDQELVAEYRDLLRASVEDCATADTELGLFLSGGIDSAAVAAFAATKNVQIHTFSVACGSTFMNGDAEFAWRVAKHLGMPNHQLIFDPQRTPTGQEWLDLLWLLETPLCNAEQFYKFELHRYAKAVRPELRGMLLGQASDEYNGGYSTVMAVGDHDWRGFEAGVGQLARAAVLHRRPELAVWWERDESLLTDALLAGSGEPYLKDPYNAFVHWKHRHVQQYNCWHEDRTAAGNGVEARVPFLDHRLVEFLARIPAQRRAALLWDKTILREAMRGLVPDQVVSRPKVPFFYGAGEGFTHRMLVRMLQQDSAALLEAALQSPGAQEYIDAGGARAMLRRLSSETEPFDVEILIRLVNMGLLDRMTRDLPDHPADRQPTEILPASTQWGAEQETLAERFHRLPGPSLEDLISFAENVLPVMPLNDPDTIYLTDSGEFRYVVSAESDPSWFRFLREIDGERALSEVLHAAGITVEQIEPTLRQAIDTGLIEVSTAPTPPELSARLKADDVKVPQ